MKDTTPFKFPALRLRQGKNRVLYSFAVDGKLIPEFANVPSLRMSDGEVNGYQRTEILKHVAEIKGYLNSENPMIPNNIVIAFDNSISFETAENDTSDAACHGIITIPKPTAEDTDNKPGQVVDGQQRIAAIRESDLASFPMFVTAFIASNENDQRGQFLLVNSAKPLPKPLIHELLPGTDVRLPTNLRWKRYPTTLMQRLNRDDDSPLQGMIRTPTTPYGVITDNSIIRMLENSLDDGVLHQYRDQTTGNGDTEAILPIIKDYWTAVSEVWPEAWGLPPRHSRLLHGAGVISLGLLMDAISDKFLDPQSDRRKYFLSDLSALKPICHWTNGIWEFDNGSIRTWNEIQNISKDIELLAEHLLSNYRRLIWSIGKS
jgi:DGQHR domain-containing protein